MAKNMVPTGLTRLPRAVASEPAALLVCAVLELAANDARQTRDADLAREARAWLLGPGQAWLAWLALDAAAVRRWVKRLPPPGQAEAEGYKTTMEVLQ